MNYRRLGKTNLMVSEIGFGGEWMERHTAEECRDIILTCEKYGINIMDCFMPNPVVRSNIGEAIKGRREKWYIQGHIGATWQDGQYTRTRDVEKCKEAFEDLLIRLQTDYIDFGMIHFVDEESDWQGIVNGPLLNYVLGLKAEGKIRHIGISTHNPDIAKKAVESGLIDLFLFSINPAYDMLPANEDLNVMFEDEYDPNLEGGITPQRAELYRLCEQYDVGITVMKAFAGGRMFAKDHSPFKVALTPIQCLHYCLTRPAVASALIGYDTPEQVESAAAYENASDEEKDYASVLANAPRYAYRGQCTYCGHCQPCPMSIDIAAVNKYYDLAEMQEKVPESVKDHYKQLKHSASDCVGCGSCESRCPFGVPIVERMEKAARIFD